LKKENIKVIWNETLEKIRQEERERIIKIIEERTPNEYAVRKYKTVEARTYDEKNLVIEAFEDLKEAILKIK